MFIYYTDIHLRSLSENNAMILELLKALKLKTWSRLKAASADPKLLLVSHCGLMYMI